MPEASSNFLQWATAATPVTDTAVVPFVNPIADAIRWAITGTGLELRDVLRVQDGRYWSYLCQNLLCCPPAGVPFNLADHPTSVAMTATSGRARDGSDLHAHIA